MNVLTVACLPPSSDRAYLDRLVLPDEPTSTCRAEGRRSAQTAADWANVHEAIQHTLLEVDQELRRRDLPITVSGGRTSGTAFCLFSFRKYSLPPSEAQESVVVGVTITREDDWGRVCGDICREESGEVLYESPWAADVRMDIRAVLEAAENVSASLAAQVDHVAQGIATLKSTGDD